VQKLLLLTYILLVPTLTLADIAFLSDRDGKPDIYVMNDEGGNVRRVTDAPFSIGNPTWSPDGRQIGFAMDLHSGEPGNPQGLRQQYDTFIINADGTRQQNLTEHPALDGGPSWAPDGKYFAFDSGRAVDGTLEIFVMEIATRKVWQLTHLGFVSSPDWSPDGKNRLRIRKTRRRTAHLHHGCRWRESSAVAAAAAQRAIWEYWHNQWCSQLVPRWRIHSLH